MSSSITENARYKPLMIDALKGIPTISLSLDNPNRLNNEDEKPLSIEMIFPDGKKGFQENAGVTHYGGYFTNFSKKSFRIYFRGELEPPSSDTLSLMDLITIALQQKNLTA